ncbi:hypothetical protein MPDQ_002881 [Monascus purpureus]|uniref:Uncharacterized protein n=1 Tax=Monascus purpureus TaxID=5098 RepID=A0A507QNM0_MONPU|nr:hypothetical protein MPDQ_002881 [Monascus purpureus]
MLGGDRTWSSELPMKGSQTSHCSPASQALLVVLQDDPRSWTLLFKKHKTTVLLMLQPHETITTAKEALLKALQVRGIKEINGDTVPDSPSEIEFGVAVDRNDLDKGWTRLEVEAPTFGKEESSSANKGAAAKKNNSSSFVSLQAADIRNGQSIVFRFRKRREETEGGDQDQNQDQPDLDNIGLEFEDPGWDVVVPRLDDEEEAS